MKRPMKRRITRRKVDAVLTDLMLPGASGFDST